MRQQINMAWKLRIHSQLKNNKIVIKFSHGLQTENSLPVKEE